MKTRVMTAVALMAAVLLGSISLMADEPVEEVESVEVVDVVQVLDTAPGVATHDESISIVQIYGRLHPAFVHLPIGFLVLLALFDFLGVIRKGGGLEKAGLVTIIATVIACLPSLLSGFLRAREMWGEREPIEALAVHRNLMFAMTGLLAVALVVRLTAKNQLSGARRWAYLALVLLALGAALVGAHEGGEMVFGEHHLPF